MLQKKTPNGHSDRKPSHEYVCTLAVASLMRTVRDSSEPATSLRFEKDDILLIVQITWQGLQKVNLSVTVEW
jgi:hypothetical protein